VQLVLNTTRSSKAVSDSRSLRRAALMNKVPYFTTVAGAVAASQAIEAMAARPMTVKPLQDYFSAA
jgi:carbamoyl-phosphate synthase large subunit